MAGNNNTTAKKAVHFGAGNIGRGFIAGFLHSSGFDVVFANVNTSHTDQLNASPSYRVIEVGAEGTTESIITNYRAINSKTNGADLVLEIATADVVTCAVGPENLESIAPLIAKGIDQRENMLPPLAVIACENAIAATDTLAEHIKNPQNTPPERVKDINNRARFANSAIDRIVPAQDQDAGLDVRIEKFHEWIVDRTPFQDHSPPNIQGIQWVDNLQPYIERKMYTVNTGHATAAYHGYNCGESTIHDALQNPYINDEVKKALSNTADLITQRHGIGEEEQNAYVQKIVQRISNPHLEDTVERVGRSPLRKLGRKERFIGPAADLAEQGKNCSAILNAVEMAFRFQEVQGDQESVELAKILAEGSPDDVVQEICGLNPVEKLYPKVADIVRRVQADSTVK